MAYSTGRQDDIEAVVASEVVTVVPRQKTSSVLDYGATASEVDSKGASDLTKTATVEDDKLGPNEDSSDAESDDILLNYKKRLPPIQWSNGPGPLFSSLGQRIRAIFTPRLLLCIVAGQLLSLCITCTSVVTTELGIGGWALPATQTFFV